MCVIQITLTRPSPTRLETHEIGDGYELHAWMQIDGDKHDAVSAIQFLE